MTKKCGSISGRRGWHAFHQHLHHVGAATEHDGRGLANESLPSLHKLPLRYIVEGVRLSGREVDSSTIGLRHASPTRRPYDKFRSRGR